MNISKLAQAIIYGKTEAKRIGNGNLCNKTWLTIYRDMLVLNARYGITSRQYSDNHLFELIGDKRRRLCLELKDQNKKLQDWKKLYRSNWRFLAKWTNEKYSGKSYLSYMRAKAYQKHYHLANCPMVQYGVRIICEHFMKGKLEIGKNVLLAKECFIDYTGNVTIKDNVKITFGVIIQSHYHPYHSDYHQGYSPVPTSIVIEEGAVIGSKAIILPSCGYIGKHARVGAGAVVTHNVPDYAVVVGNPAKIIRIQE